MNSKDLDTASEKWREHQYDSYMEDDDDDRMLSYLEEHEEEYKMAEELIQSGCWAWKLSDIDDLLWEFGASRIRKEYADYLESLQEESASKEQ